MSPEIEIQTKQDLKVIDYMRKNNEVNEAIINEQNNALNDISDNLAILSDNIMMSNVIDNNIDLSEVTEKLDNIDTSIVETTTQDILSMINNQQEQINNIEEQINSIDEKLDKIINKM